jgi:hypothetical protein
MVRTKFILLLIAGFVLFSSLTSAESPQNYTVSYIFKNSDGTPFRVIKYYLLEGVKFRVEYYSCTQPVELSVSVEAESELGSSPIKKESKVNVDINEETGLQAGPTKTEPHTVEILRKDKNLVWSMDPFSNQYIEVPLREDSWERSLTGIVIRDFTDFTKTGETTLLKYSCSIYMSVQKVGDNKWTNTFYVVDGLNVILKSETRKNDELVQIQEAAEFSEDQPEQSFFEVPEGYQKNDNN